MEIVVTARHTEVSGRFRRHLEEKLAKVEHLAPKGIRLEVGISHEANKRQADACERIEITLVGKGPVVRAEACAGDPYSALDQATTKLLERLRRAADRKKVHHGSRHPMASVRLAGDVGPVPVSDDQQVLALDGAAAPDPSAAAVLDDPTLPDPAGAPGDGDVAAEWSLGESPVVIREKVHVSRPMVLDEALTEMELVGHDFFLFTDSSTGCPSVVYRRRGWSYGVIRLAGDADQAQQIARAVAEAGAAASATDGAGAAEPQVSGSQDAGRAAVAAG